MCPAPPMMTPPTVQVGPSGRRTRPHCCSRTAPGPRTGARRGSSSRRSRRCVPSPRRRKRNTSRSSALCPQVRARQERRIVSKLRLRLESRRVVEHQKPRRAEDLLRRREREGARDLSIAKQCVSRTRRGVSFVGCTLRDQDIVFPRLIRSLRLTGFNSLLPVCRHSFVVQAAVRRSPEDYDRPLSHQSLLGSLARAPAHARRLRWR